MNHILVLGAGGFIGRELCKQLSKTYQVRAFDLIDMVELRETEGIECVTGNYLEIRDYNELFEGIDTVIDLICTTLPKESTAQIPNEIETNLVPLVVLLENLVKYNINNFLFISSAGTVYGEGSPIGNREQDELVPICSYGALKKVSEAYIEFYNARYHKKFKVVRISNLYGIGQSVYRSQGIIPIFMNCIFAGKSITVFGDGNNRRNYIYIDDAISGIIQTLEYEGQYVVFNLAGEKSYTINEIIALIEKETGQRFHGVEYVDYRLCDVRENVVNTRLAMDELGWNAVTDISKGISIISEILKSNINRDDDERK